MSDQHETFRSLDRRRRQDQEDDDDEEDDTMRVRFTHIIDGFFKFASTRSMGSSQAEQMDSASSGRSSPSSFPDHNRRNNPQNMASSSATASNNNNANNSSTESLGGSRRRSTKKVKFKDYPPRTNRASNSPSRRNSNDSQRRNSNDSQRSSNDNMDGSTSSIASWDIRIESEGGGGVGSAVHNSRTKLSPPAAAALRPTLNNSKSNTAGNRGEENESNNSGGSIALWFEKYMPNGVNRVREICGRIVNNETFQLIMILLIVANALVMGVGTFDFIDNNPDLRRLFELVDLVFLVVFTIELALQFGYWGYQLFYDGWLVFDFVTIMSSWALDGVQVFRSFRIFRAFRLIVRIPILKSLVYAVIHVLPRISSIMALFALMIYIFAVMTTTLFKDYYALGITEDDYFGRLDYSLFTLFQFVTLEGWADIVRDVAEVDYYAYFIFGTFLTISSFILYSLVVAVICDSFLIVESRIRGEMKEEKRLERERRRLLKITRKKGARNVFEAEDDPQEVIEEDSEVPDPNNPLRRNMRSPPPRGRQQAATHGMRTPPPRRMQQPPSSPARSSKTNSQRASSLPPSSRTPPRTPPPRKKSSGMYYDSDKEEETEEENAEEELMRGVSRFTEITSPTATTVTTTLVSGEMERRRFKSKKKRTKSKKRRPVNQRISRVQMKLDNLARTQGDILSTLDDLCALMEDDP